MPTSTYEHVPTLVKFLIKVNPRSIFDVGVGNGKMGFIARDLLDVMLGQRYQKEEWQIRIDGVEVFPNYIQEHQRVLYDQIFIGDAYRLIDTVGQYDLIILGDVLEHFEREKALHFLDKCARHCTYIILSIPLGEKWKQPAVYGNPYEEHLSFWKDEEFEAFALDRESFPFPNIGADYGCFLIRAEDYRHHRIREKADALFSEGKKDQAINKMIASLAELSSSIASEYVLVNLFLENHQIEEAIDRLRTVTRAFPDERSAMDFLQALTARVEETPRKA